MVRLIREGSGDWERRSGLSEFQIAIDEAAYYKNSKPLAKLLRTDYKPTKADRAMLADFVEGKLRRPRGAPKGKRYAVRTDFFAMGDMDYSKTMSRWHTMKGKQIKFRRRQDGRMVSIRGELCRRIAVRRGCAHRAGQLEDYVKRAQSRR
jgi:hypothetical protein